MSVLKFLWAHRDSAMVQSYQDALAQSQAETGIAPTPENADIVISFFLLLFPFVYLACHGVAALLLKIWGKGTPAVLRMRYYFSGLLPGVLLGLIASVVYGLLPSRVFESFDYAMLIFLFALYVLNVSRVLSSKHSLPNRLGRGMGFGLTAVAMDFMVAGLCITGAYILFMVQHANV